MRSESSRIPILSDFMIFLTWYQSIYGVSIRCLLRSFSFFFSHSHHCTVAASPLSMPPLACSSSLFTSSTQTTSVKLDKCNYLFWESIVLPLIKGNSLVSHIDGTAQIPSRLQSDCTSNPAFNESNNVDRLLVGWLRNAMTLEVGTQFMHYRTDKALWDVARTLTCSSLKSRTMVSKTEFHQIRK